MKIANLFSQFEMFPPKYVDGGTEENPEFDFIFITGCDAFMGPIVFKILQASMSATGTSIIRDLRRFAAEGEPDVLIINRALTSKENGIFTTCWKYDRAIAAFDKVNLPGVRIRIYDGIAGASKKYFIPQ